MSGLLTASVVIFALSVGGLTFVLAMSRHRKACGDDLRLIGEVGSVEEALQPEGSVLVRGELWRARLRTGTTTVVVARGRRNVRVVGAKAHLLEVEEVAAEK